MSLNGLSEDTTVSAGDGLSLSTAGVLTADVLQSEVDAKQATVTAGTGLSFSGATLNAEVTQAELDDKQATVTAGTGLSFSGATLNAEVTQAEVDAKQATITAGTGLSFSGATLNAAATDITGKLDKPSNLGSSAARLMKYTQSGIPNIAQVENISDVLTAGTNISFSGTTINAAVSSVSGNLAVKGNLLQLEDSGASSSVTMNYGSNTHKVNLGAGALWSKRGLGIDGYNDSNNWGTLCHLYGGHACYFPNGTTTSSDQRIKFNVVTLSNCLHTLKACRPIAYDRAAFTEREGQVLSVDDTKLRPQTGFVAQELHPVIPHVVELGNTQKLATVDYMQIIPYTVGGIKELKTENDSQTTIIATLVARVKALEDKIAAL